MNSINQKETVNSDEVFKISAKGSPLKTNPRISKVAFLALTALCVLFAAGLAASGAFVASPLGAGLMIGSVVLIVCTVAFKCLKKKSSGDKESEETPVREAINPENRVLEEEQKKEPPHKIWKKR